MQHDGHIDHLAKDRPGEYSFHHVQGDGTCSVQGRFTSLPVDMQAQPLRPSDIALCHQACCQLHEIMDNHQKDSLLQLPHLCNAVWTELLHADSSFVSFS